MATFGAIYAILALGLNVMWGMAGMVNLGIVGFYGFGAYISALLTVKAHAPIALGFAAAMAGTAVDGGAGDARHRRGCATTISPSSRSASPRRAHRRRERDLADARHRRHLRHSAAAEILARVGFQRRLSGLLPRRSGRRAFSPGARAHLAVRARAARDPRGRAGRGLRRQGRASLQGEAFAIGGGSSASPARSTRTIRAISCRRSTCRC